MKKVIAMDNYSQGIAETEVICTDIPIAAVCGLYDSDYYYFYLMLRAVKFNWTHQNTTYDEDMFTGMGLCYKTVSIKDKRELLEKIREYIDQEIPLLLKVKYSDMFFSERYQKKEHRDNHMLLINGYDSDRGILYTRLSPHVFSEATLNHNVGLYSFRLRNDMVTDMWQLSREKNYTEFGKYEDQLLVIENKFEPRYHSLKDIVEHILRDVELKDSRFIKSIERQLFDNKASLMDLMWYLRIFHEKYMEVFFQIVQKYMKEEYIEDTFQKEFTSVCQEYIRKRNLTISNFQKNVMKGQKIDTEKIVQETQKMDEQLWDYLKKLYHILQKKSNAYENIVTSCKLTVSSADEPYYSARNMLEENEKLWRSENLTEDHWVLFEFSKTMQIHKMILYHDMNYNKMTRDFIIQSSLDGKEWKNIDEIVSNIKSRTVHRFNSIVCQYVRIVITNPANMGKQARVRKVEIYGG